MANTTGRVRNRWRRALVDLTIHHMIEDGKGRCAQCPVGTPCDISSVVTRINPSIARQIAEIAEYACMDDGEREVALGNRRITRCYEDDGDWEDDRGRYDLLSQPANRRSAASSNRAAARCPPGPGARHLARL